MSVDAASREAPDNLDNSLDPPERATTVTTESVVEYSDSQQNVSQVALSTPPRTEENSDGNSPVSVQDTNPRSGCSPLSELLVYPSSSNKQKPAAKSYAACILTSAQSIAFLEEKKKKKLDEEEEKKRKREERAMKKAAKEEEKRRKALEREAKKAKVQQKRKDQGTRKQPVKSTAKNGSKRQNVDNGEEGLQRQEISQNKCAACFGLWEEDDTDEWLQCTNSDCGVWCHAECSEQAYICLLCQTCFV